MDPAPSSLSHTPEGAEEPQAAQVDVAGEEQGTARSSGGGEEGGAHESRREDQAAKQSGGDESNDPCNSDPGRRGNNTDAKVRAYWAKMESCQSKDANMMDHTPCKHVLYFLINREALVEPVSYVHACSPYFSTLERTTRMRSDSDCPSTWTPHTSTPYSARVYPTHGSRISPFTDSSACVITPSACVHPQKERLECAA